MIRFWLTYGFLVCVFTLAGQSGGRTGATQLLINPWAQSSGEAGANTAYGKGLEMTYMNPAGIEPEERTELVFSRTNWLQGSEIYINTFGISQRFNNKSSLALSIMSFNMEILKLQHRTILKEV